MLKTWGGGNRSDMKDRSLKCVSCCSLVQRRPRAAVRASQFSSFQIDSEEPQNEKSHLIVKAHLDSVFFNGNRQICSHCIAVMQLS